MRLWFLTLIPSSHYISSGTEVDERFQDTHWHQCIYYFFSLAVDAWLTCSDTDPTEGITGNANVRQVRVHSVRLSSFHLYSFQMQLLPTHLAHRVQCIELCRPHGLMYAIFNSEEKKCSCLKKLTFPNGCLYPQECADKKYKVSSG